MSLINVFISLHHTVFQEWKFLPKNRMKCDKSIFRIDTFTDIKTDRSLVRLSIGFIQLSITPGLCFFPSIIESSISFNHSTIEKRSAFQVSSKQVMVYQPNKWLQAETCHRHILIRIFTFYVRYMNNIIRYIIYYFPYSLWVELIFML